MRLVCLMPVRNESWVLGLSARAVLMWCDELILLDHCSTDASRDIGFDLIRQFPNRITDLADDDPQWNEMAHRQRLLEMARDQGATHIVMVDADEVLTGNLLPSVRDFVRCVAEKQILQLPWLCMRDSITRYHTTGMWSQQDVSMAFRDDPRYHWAARDGYDFHHRHPMGLPFAAYKPITREQGGLMHLQFVSERRLKAKQALYKMTEVIRWPGREPVSVVDERYSRAVYSPEPEQGVSGLVQRFGVAGAAAIRRAAMQANPSLTVAAEIEPPAAFTEAPTSWWAPYAHLMQYLDVNAEPWQEIEAQRLWVEHGPAKFAGLDLFGVCG
jgi:hypothetical protein